MHPSFRSFVTRLLRLRPPSSAVFLSAFFAVSGRPCEATPFVAVVKLARLVGCPSQWAVHFGGTGQDAKGEDAYACLEPTKLVDLGSLEGQTFKGLFDWQFKKSKYNGPSSPFVKPYGVLKLVKLNPPQNPGTKVPGRLEALTTFAADIANAAPSGVVSGQTDTKRAGDENQPTSNLGISGVQSSATEQPGNSCSLSIAMGNGETQFDTTCGPQCSQIRLYPEVTESLHTDRIRGTEFKARIVYYDGTFLDQVGTSGGDMLSGQSTFKSRANFDRPHMILVQSGSAKIWQPVRVREVQFNNVSCVLK